MPALARPPRPFARRFAGAAAVASMLAAAAPSAATAQDGVTFTYRVQGTAARQGNAPAAGMLATVRIAGGNARVDFREGGGPLGRDGAYMIVRGADRQMLLVQPKDQRVMIMDAAAMGSSLGALTNNAMVKVAVKDARFAYEDLGAGERILGYPTRRLRASWGSTTEMRVMMRRQTTTDSSTSEMWVTPSVPGVDPEALRGWSRAFGAGLRRTNSEMAQQMEEFDRRFGAGLALRSVIATTQRDDKGRTTVDTARMEVTDLTRGRVDPAAFEAPAGYQTTDMRQVLAAADSVQRAAGMDTSSLAGQAKQGAQEGARESVREGAKNAAKNAIGGLFGRRRP